MQRGRADEVGEDDGKDLEEALEDAVSLFGGELLGQGMERGGEGGIRTPGTLAGTPDFESRYAVYCGVLHVERARQVADHGVEVERVARQVARRLARLLERRGLGDDAAAEDDILATEEPLLASLYAASITSRVATGSRSGQRVLRMGDRIDAGDLPVLQGERCATVGGVSVHANVAVPARDRRRLERLCRYGARPAIATERASRLEDGRVLYRLKHRWRDGTTHVVFTPQELVEKIGCARPAAALPSRPLPRRPGPVRERARSHRAGGGGRAANSILFESRIRIDIVAGRWRSRERSARGDAGLRLDRDARFDAPRRLARDSVGHRGCQRWRVGPARRLEGETARVG